MKRLHASSFVTQGYQLVLMAVFLSAAFTVGGCDKLPWSSGASDNDPSAAMIAGAPLVSPPRPVVLPANVIATVNGVSISKDDLELRIQDLRLQSALANPLQAWEPLIEEELEILLDELVNAELISQSAVNSGLHQQLDTQRRWEFVRRGFFAQEWLRSMQDQLVTNKDIEQHFEQNKQGFREPERVKLRQLSVASEDEARSALSRVHSGDSDFQSLVRELSIGPTAAQGGILRGWIMRANEKLLMYGSETEAARADVFSLDPNLERAAFAIDQLNGISNYVTGIDNRYHIFQLAERLDGRQMTLNEVWDGIKAFLLAESIQGKVEALSSGAAIQRYPDRLINVSQEEITP